MPARSRQLADGRGFFPEEFRLQREKVRIYALARELNIESKDLLEMCRQAGYDVKNQLSSLDPEQRDAVEVMVKKGAQPGGGVAVAAAPKAVSAPPAGPIPVLAPQRPRTLPSTKPARKDVAATTIEPPHAAPAQPTTTVSQSAPAAKHAEPPATAKPTHDKPAAKTPATGVPRAPETPPTPPTQGTPSKPLPQTQMPAAVTPPTENPGRMPDLGGRSQSRPDGGQKTERRRPPLVPRPPGIRLASPPPLRQRPADDKKPQQPVIKRQQPIMALPPEVARGERNLTAKDLLQQPGKGGVVPVAPEEIVDEEEGEGRGGTGKVRPGSVAGRDQRHAKRNDRAKQRKGPEGPIYRTGAGGVIVEVERPLRIKQKLKMRKQDGRTKPRKGKVPVTLPITVRSLSEAVGVRSAELLFKLKDHGVEGNLTINSSLDPVMAEAMALELGCELEVKKPFDVEEELSASLKRQDNPEDQIHRAPIVTIMGHVDHGKTSLLDRIRKSNVVDTEAGGITQVIRAWRVEHNGHPITFLDTPGHEAFTKMRARGANVTDIAVIVVAVDDGVMPQTEEAINHAKAAGVSIIVCLNKIDLPNANIRKAEQQLYGLGVLPDNMGGEAPFVQTSAATGKGIDELLEAITLVAELKELRANPKKPGAGTVLEAMLTEGEGVVATLLVQEGTLRRGDFILCGSTYGRVRAMYNDQGRPIADAGPSVPVRVTGLDEVPDADDPFQVVEEVTVAREIAEKRRDRQVEASYVRREPMRLESLAVAKIAELKVILKADFRGSVEAIKKELEKLHHEEVRVRLLEAAIGGITENDVWLALTSPQDTIIVGFNVVPDDRAKALAEDRGVQIREYDIIYRLTEDIRAALEGKLKPREEVVHLGRAIVRETFKISRVGTIAGCIVTQGTIERSAKVRVIRDGVVIYPPTDRTASLESLKRFKEDAREVREGFECGLKIAGYDDIKVGDAIEAYRVEHVQRTLS
jgi:translation initiation factor IF-2